MHVLLIIILGHASTMIILHVCTAILVHACTMIKVHASTMIIVHACTMIIVHACDLIIKPACTMIFVDVSCPTGLMFDAIQIGGRSKQGGLGYLQAPQLLYMFFHQLGSA